MRILIEVVKNLPALRDAIDEAVRAAAARVDDALADARTFIDNEQEFVEGGSPIVIPRRGGRAPADR